MCQRGNLFLNGVYKLLHTMIAHTFRFGTPVALAIATAGWLQLGILDVPLGYVQQLPAVYIDARVGYATSL